MNLFDHTICEPTTSMSNPYSTFAAFNQDGSLETQNIRNKLEHWFQKFPSSSQNDLRSRFRSNRPDDHEAAFFELFLHELLTNLGLKIEVHPTLPDSTRHPDFLVCEGRKYFYLEAATTGKKSGPYTPTKIEQQIIEKLRKLTSPNFNLSIEMIGTLSKSIKTERLLRKVTTLLQKHQPDEVEAIIHTQGSNAAPSEQEAHEDWSIKVWLSPISAPARRPNQIRPVTVNFMKAKFTNAIDPVKNKLQEKSTSYGNPQIPLVVAVHTQDPFYTGQESDMEVLFGKERIVYVDGSPQRERAPNGAWSGGHGRRIAAFFRVQKADIRNFPHASGCLYINPSQPNIDLPAALLRLPHANSIYGNMTWSDGINIGQLL